MISTHILDTSLGLPAADVAVSLSIQNGNTWQTLAEERTNADGRIVFNVKSQAGIYRLCFEIEAYFMKLKIKPFFVTAPVIFEISDINRKYHIPLLLNPFGYSTYRGS